MLLGFTWCLVFSGTVVRGYDTEESHCEDGECEASSLMQRVSHEEITEMRLGSMPPNESTRRIASYPGDSGATPVKPVQLVHEVYTYGAPATHQTSFRNAARTDCCFVGLRTFTEGKAGVFGEIRLVDAASIFIPYPHAYTNSLVLHSGADSLYTPCNDEQPGHPDWPRRQGLVVDSWGLHHEDSYVGWLENVSVDGEVVVEREPFASARLFSRLAFRSYDTFKDQKAAIAEHMPGWRLVHRADDKNYTDIDPIMVLQQESTLGCALVFTGTNDPAEYAASTTMHGVDFCGFHGVHFGYQKELRNLNMHLWHSLRPKLEHCGTLTCVGHSLGGALCELFAACANSGNVSDSDYQRMAWTPKEPQLMEAAQTVDEPWRRRL